MSSLMMYAGAGARLSRSGRVTVVTGPPSASSPAASSEERAAALLPGLAAGPSF